MELENILPLLKIFNAIAVILLNASPVLALFKIMKGNEKYTYLPFLMLIFFALNHLCWTCYWLKISDMIFMLSYYISTIIGSGLLIIYLYFLCKYKKGFFISSVISGNLLLLKFFLNSFSVCQRDVPCCPCPIGFGVSILFVIFIISLSKLLLFINTIAKTKSSKNINTKKNSSKKFLFTTICLK